MKIKKRLFPFILIFAIILTCTGLLTINKSFAVSAEEELKEFNLYISEVYTKNVSVLSSESTYMTYIINLDENKNEYELSFNVINDNKYNLFLTNYYLDNIPDELKDIVDVEVTKDDRINSYDKTHMTIKYKLKNDLSDEEKNTLKNNKNIKVNLLLNYIQE
jgi:hypothetical protein